MTENEARVLLKRAVSKAGGQAPFAELVGVSRAYINDVYHGRRNLGPRVLTELGLVAVTTTKYEMKKGGNT